jgi:hypothetical protein
MVGSYSTLQMNPAIDKETSKQHQRTTTSTPKEGGKEQNQMEPADAAARNCHRFTKHHGLWVIPT